MNTSTSKAPKYGKDKVFKIEFSSVKSGLTKRFAGSGRYGKTWETAGALRLHITQNIERLSTIYKGARVAIITTDGVVTTDVSYLPIIEFYRASPDSNRQFFNHFGSTMSNFELSKRTSEFV